MSAFYHVRGTGYELGVALGKAQRERLRTFRDNHFYHLDWFMEPGQRHERLKSIADSIRKYAPSSHEEIAGFAEGADISLEDALLLQSRRELVGYQSVGGDCSTLLQKRSRDFIAGQTVDLNGLLDPWMCVLKLERKSPLPSVLMYTVHGLLGYMGINSHGLGVCINLILAGQWGVGVPPYIIVREILNKPSLEDALTYIRNTPFASSRSLTLFQGQSAYCVEHYVNSFSIREINTFCRTNHILFANGTVKDELNIFARNGSLRRLALVDSALHAATENMDPEQIFQALTHHGDPNFSTCIHRSGSLKQEYTVGAVVLAPGEGAMHVKGYPPCQELARSYQL